MLCRVSDVVVSENLVSIQFVPITQYVNLICVTSMCHTKKQGVHYNNQSTQKFRQYFVSKNFHKKYIWDKIFLSTFNRAGHKIIKIIFFDMLASPTKVFNPCQSISSPPLYIKITKFVQKGANGYFFDD